MNIIWQPTDLAAVAAFAQSAPKDAVGARRWLASALALDAQVSARAGTPDFRENAETREAFMHMMVDADNVEMLRVLAQLPERDWHFPGKYFSMPGDGERRLEEGLFWAKRLERWEAAAALSEHLDFGSWKTPDGNGLTGGQAVRKAFLEKTVRSPELREPIARILGRIAETSHLSGEEWNVIAGRAAELDSVALLERAAKAGVDLRASFAVNITTYDSVTKRPLLCVAAAAAATRVAEWLMAQGQAPDECADPMGNTPLMWATKAIELYHADEDRLLECVKKLARSSQIDAQAKNGKTALSWAATAAGHGYGAKSFFFLIGQANPNFKDEDGDTALMTAMEAGCDYDGNATPGALPVVEALAAVSDMSLKNEKGQTAVDIAISMALQNGGNQGARSWEMANALFAGMDPKQACEAMMAIAKKIVPRAVPKLEALALGEELGRAPKTQTMGRTTPESELGASEGKEADEKYPEASVAANRFALSSPRVSGRNRL